MSDCVSSSDKISTMAWLGGWPLVTKNNDTFNQMSGNTSQNQGTSVATKLRRFLSKDPSSSSSSVHFQMPKNLRKIV